jgi:hypothetical protein
VELGLCVVERKKVTLWKVGQTGGGGNEVIKEKYSLWF